MANHCVACVSSSELIISKGSKARRRRGEKLGEKLGEKEGVEEELCQAFPALPLCCHDNLDVHAIWVELSTYGEVTAVVVNLKCQHVDQQYSTQLMLSFLESNSKEAQTVCATDAHACDKLACC